MKAMALVFSISTLVALSGCASMSGFDAKSKFACKAPDGILCQSMSGIYANAQAKNLPGQRMGTQHEATVDFSQGKALNGVMTKPLSSGTPIRSAARLLRVWMAPWEDSDGDLHDQSYIYMAVDSGRWEIEHNHSQILDTYKPVRTPSNLAASPFVEQRNGVSTVRQNKSYEDSPDNPTESIGAHQDRMTKEQATALLNGIMRPGNVMTNSD